MDVSIKKLCMIPGPIEFHEDVLSAMSYPATSHVDPRFIEVFGANLDLLRQVFFASSKTQPFILSGSGVMGWDSVAANLLHQGDEVLVLSTGVFGDRYVDSLEAYGAKVTKLDAPLGGAHDISAVEEELKKKNYKMVTITQVDTSTGVLSDVKSISLLVKKVLPQALVIVDAVCSAAAEELRFDDWKVDVVHTASQKAIGVPPGLCLFVVSEHALTIFNSRTQPIPNYYLSWKRWIPIMQSYEARKPSYFATPAVQLVNALYISLKQILEKGMDAVFEAHITTSNKFKAEIKAMGFSLVTLNDKAAANTMTTIYYPEGIIGPDFLQAVSQRGVMLAGGLHPQMAAKYFRVGHMGISAREPSREHLTNTLQAIQGALEQVRSHSS